MVPLRFPGVEAQLVEQQNTSSFFVGSEKDTCNPRAKKQPTGR